MTLPDIGSTPRTTINRLGDRSVSERSEMYRILDNSILCHIGYVEEGQPFVLPYAYTRDNDRLIFHGSTGARFMRAIAAGADICVTVTKLNALVVARTAFDSSMNYESVVVLGKGYEIIGAEKEQLLDKVTDSLLPGRTKEVRGSIKKEFAATALVAVDLTEASVKVRNKNAYDDEGEGTGVWSGLVPIKLVAEEPIAADAEAAALPIPPSVLAYSANPKA
jgi:nitroimidazol reductase NimA-like FMN-containing flavoprotein (pyridoxamine 5'-phosphate oxidase superfamily)